MKHIKAFLTSLALTTALGAAMPRLATAQTEIDQWSVQTTERLGATAGRFCAGARCKADEQAYVEKLIKICLYRDPKTAGLFSRGEWRSHVGQGEPEACSEELYADTARKVMYIVGPFQGAGSVFLPARPPSLYCGAGPQIQGRNPCSSAFLVSREANSSYKVVDLARVQRIVDEAKVFDAIDRHTQSLAEQQKAQQRAQYLAEFESAKGSLKGIEQFEAKYGANDPDALIPQLAGLKHGLRLQEYEERFAKMSSIPEIERFIADYEQDDLGQKVPQARQRLTQEKQREAAAAKVRDQQKAAEERNNRLQALERRMAWCKQEMAAARRAIDQENQIGRVSGFVNKQRLRTAGEAIVVCERGNLEDIEEYRRLGGKKSYADLR